ncbi:hypothetical protein [Micromonospora eburnea]|uniref:Uncharacterized protein n=1 Tax=Micromonospora eburnea TaxID=227316 RepID=A0A1C6TTR3_9ACTN|nr:hypothetical protein [Micromonospora eburnea]SCL45069.1 hypothetical protein GA0070604_0765 [Micromonospora eburnea]
MRDDDLAFVELMQRELRDVRWPEPAEIRARARRRSRRTAVVAAMAVLAVTSASAVAVAARPGLPTAPASVAATAEPSPSERVLAEVPLDVLLGPADVRTQSEALTQAGLDEPVRVDAQLLLCHKRQGHTASWESSRYSRSVTLVRSRSAVADNASAEFVLSEDVYRVAPEVGRRFFAGIDKMLAPCENWRSRGPTQWQGEVVDAEVIHRWQVVDRNFAGTESVLLRHTVGQARNLKTGQAFGSPSPPASTAVVRAGDLVSVIKLGRDGTEPELRRLATVAAERMCPAANSRC